MSGTFLAAYCFDPVDVNRVNLAFTLICHDVGQVRELARCMPNLQWTQGFGGARPSGDFSFLRAVGEA